MKKRGFSFRVFLSAALEVFSGAALIRVNALDRGNSTGYQRSSEDKSGMEEDSSDKSDKSGTSGERGNRFDGKSDGDDGVSGDNRESGGDEDGGGSDVDGDTYHFAFEWNWQGSREIGCDLSMSDILKSEKELANLQFSDNPFAALGIDWKKYSETERNTIFWAALYRHLLSKNTGRIDVLIGKFRELRDKEGLSENELLECILTFVQNIKYQRPGGTLDILTQPDALYKKFGDCDTKSLLLVTILEKLGYDTVIYYSSYYSHVMAGIYMNGTGSYKKIDGKKYYFTETTYAGWKPGTLPAEFNNTRYWQVCQIH